MKRMALFVGVVLFALSSASAGIYTLNPVLDYGDDDGGGSIWGYICLMSGYQAWFGFDVAVIPDSEVITGISFTAFASSDDDDGIERSLWYEPDDSWIGSSTNQYGKFLSELVGTGITDLQPAWLTIALDLAGHDWQTDLADDQISLMLTGPTSGYHECGRVDFTESGNLPVLTITTGTGVIPEPATLSLLVLGGLGLLARRRRRR